MRILLTMLVLMFVFSMPAAAGGPADGELFGYKLGEVYNFAEEYLGSTDYIPNTLSEAARERGIDKIVVERTHNGEVAFKIIARKDFGSWEGAKIYANEISYYFQNQVGGDILIDVLSLVRTPYDPDKLFLPNHFIFKSRIDERYQLDVTLIEDYWKGLRHSVKIEYSYAQGSYEACNMEKLNRKYDPDRIPLGSYECEVEQND